MHPEAMDAVRRMMVESDFTKHGPPVTADHSRLAIDFGGADVNGTARDLFDPATTWLGLDIAPGPGVDIVADARTWDWHSGNLTSPRARLSQHHRIDLILCTELLEHVPPFLGDIADSGWVAVLGTIHRVLKPGGFAFVTCAGTGRRPHGARGEHDVPEGEWYRNVHPDVFATVAETQGWDDFDWQYNPNPGDLYAWLRKA